MFIDLRKAFGSVHHDLLINKLESYGLRNTLNWIVSKAIYLIASKLLALAKRPLIIAQLRLEFLKGSILGLLLFVLFTNDLSKVLTQCQILMYADDTVMYFSAIDSQVITYGTSVTCVYMTFYSYIYLYIMIIITSIPF